MIKLVYFEGCPNADRVKKSLMATGLNFDEVRQNELPENHLFQGFTSPTILKDGEVIFGEVTNLAGGCSLNIPSTQEIIKRLGVKD
jgi:hypothetical protein